MLYERLRTILTEIAAEHDLLDESIVIESSVLTPDEAIGNPGRQDFPLQKGQEALIQAAFMDSKGQAYTDAPSRFRGNLQDIIALDLSTHRETALFIATLNAVARYVHPDLRTIHCRDNGPERCAKRIAEYVQALGPQSLGMIGLQPAILEALVAAMGKDHVRCIDRDEENRGRVKNGVTIEWGDADGLKRLFEESDLIFATGSSAANGSLADILALADITGKPVYFYGTTIAATARLLGLDHLCYESQ
ncbi:MAG: hypothetical protein JXI32_05735 [Deltaproteobacteria bacterium]|nr:hypothetical protein [Deltaproteobacteria bacterium]